MGLFFGDDYTDDAINAEQSGFDQGSAALAPYTGDAGADFENARDALYQQFGMVAQQPQYGQQFLDYLSGSPADLLNQAMSGYSMSPETQNQMKLGLSAANNTAATTGMYGSGDNMMADAEIASMLYGQGMDDYLKQLTDALGIQGDIFGGYSQHVGNLAGMFQDMLGTEEGASSQLADMAMQLGSEQGRTYDQAGMEQGRNIRNAGNTMSRMGRTAGYLYGPAKAAVPGPVKI